VFVLISNCLLPFCYTTFNQNLQTNPLMLLFSIREAHWHLIGGYMTTLENVSQILLKPVLLLGTSLSKLAEIEDIWVINPDRKKILTCAGCGKAIQPGDSVILRNLKNEPDMHLPPLSTKTPDGSLVCCGRLTCRGVYEPLVLKWNGMLIQVSTIPTIPLTGYIENY
jgi:hypothetical protein